MCFSPILFILRSFLVLPPVCKLSTGFRVTSFGLWHDGDFWYLSLYRYLPVHLSYCIVLLATTPVEFYQGSSITQLFWFSGSYTWKNEDFERTMTDRNLPKFSNTSTPPFWRSLRSLFPINERLMALIRRWTVIEISGDIGPVAWMEKNSLLSVRNPHTWRSVRQNGLRLHSWDLNFEMHPPLGCCRGHSCFSPPHRNVHGLCAEPHLKRL